MSILFLAPNRDIEPIKDAIKSIDPNISVEIGPHINDKKRVQFAVVWNQPAGVLEPFPNIKAVSSLGAGVDHILQDKTIPHDISICRIITPSLIQQMKEYVFKAILNYQHHTLEYVKQCRQARWEKQASKMAENIPIGIMGLGKLGQPIARQLACFGYSVFGWAKHRKNISGVQTFGGANQLQSFLGKVNILVCMLPLTEKTQGILNIDVFKKIKRPAYLINVARGGHLVDEDLLYALDKQWLEGACLDVFKEEPLPSNHPFWNRPNILITPHVSSITRPADAARQIIENYKRLMSGQRLKHVVNRQKGY